MIQLQSHLNPSTPCSVLSVADVARHSSHYEQPNTAPRLCHPLAPAVADARSPQEKRMRRITLQCAVCGGLVASHHVASGGGASHTQSSLFRTGRQRERRAVGIRVQLHTVPFP